ncbi:hypothetical protein WR25_13425 [Diploscapter pachys]|uniref:Uncharacterized protein n=1 Tax=Diploscapter pachys TaxID=2018661 RepID=A0A2A2KGJ1_9BILA|nr:hypothetical protein WR25_13425 [Diploscapter pachys]
MSGIKLGCIDIEADEMNRIIEQRQTLLIATNLQLSTDRLAMFASFPPTLLVFTCLLTYGICSLNTNSSQLTQCSRRPTIIQKDTVRTDKQLQVHKQTFHFGKEAPIIWIIFASIVAQSSLIIITYYMIDINYEDTSSDNENRSSPATNTTTQTENSGNVSSAEA